MEATKQKPSWAFVKKYMRMTKAAGVRLKLPLLEAPKKGTIEMEEPCNTN